MRDERYRGGSLRSWRLYTLFLSFFLRACLKIWMNNLTMISILKFQFPLWGYFILKYIYSRMVMGLAPSLSLYVFLSVVVSFVFSPPSSSKKYALTRNCRNPWNEGFAHFPNIPEFHLSFYLDYSWTSLVWYPRTTMQFRKFHQGNRLM